MPAAARSTAQPPASNLALVPGSLLPVRELWQQVADTLPVGAVLVVLPNDDGAQRRALESVALLLRAEGRQVTIMSAEPFRASTTRHGQLPLALPS